MIKYWNLYKVFIIKISALIILFSLEISSLAFGCEYQSEVTTPMIEGKLVEVFDYHPETKTYFLRVEGKNSLYREDEKKLIPLVGKWGGHFSADGDLVFVKGPGDLLVYRLSGFLTDPPATKNPLISDPHLKGKRFIKTPQEKGFRLYAISDQVTYKDFNMSEGSISAINLLPKKICNKISFNGQVTLSPDANFLAATNQLDSTTSVFKIENNDTCNLVKKMDYQTGPVEFSKDSQTMSFTILSPGEETKAPTFNKFKIKVGLPIPKIKGRKIASVNLKEIVPCNEKETSPNSYSLKFLAAKKSKNCHALVNQFWKKQWNHSFNRFKQEVNPLKLTTIDPTASLLYSVKFEDLAAVCSH